MTEDEGKTKEEILAMEVDDEDEAADNQSETSGDLSASAPYSASGRSQYALDPVLWPPAVRLTSIELPQNRSLKVF